MADKTKTNPKGAGRPKVEDGLKKVGLSLKVPAWVKETIDEGGINASKLVTKLLEGHFRYGG